MCAAYSSERCIVSMPLNYDTVGIRGVMQQLYLQKGVNLSMNISLNYLVFVTKKEMKKINLEATQEFSVHNTEVEIFEPSQVISRASKVVFSDSSKRKLFESDTSNDNILHFAGSGEEHSVDGPSLKCSFKEPFGIAVEFDQVVFIIDTMNTFIIMISFIKNNVKFLKAVREIYEAFSVHEKKKEFTTYSPEEASNKVQKL